MCVYIYMCVCVCISPTKSYVSTTTSQLNTTPQRSSSNSPTPCVFLLFPQYEPRFPIAIYVLICSMLQ